MDLPFVPMLLDRANAPFADDRWICQVKWDGVRNLAAVEEGRIRHWSRRLRERTHLYPEFDELAALLPGPRTVLDGEIIVLRQGLPSFAGILERDVAGTRPDARRLQTQPATFMVFDLLEHRGEQLYNLPLAQRLERLGQVLPDSASWQMVESFPGQSAPDLFASVTALDMEGVVVKRSASRYVPGARTRDWLKVKRRRQMLAVICGYTTPTGGSGGLILGGYRQGRLVYIGRVGSGLRSEHLALIHSTLRPAPRPFDYEPALRDRFSGAPGPVVWTEPRLTVRVEFSAWTEEQKLRDPVFIGFASEPPEAAEMR